MRLIILILIGIYTFDSKSQNLGQSRNYDVFNISDDGKYRKIKETDSELIFHPYYDTTLICVFRRHKPFEVRDSEFNLLESGYFISNVCKNRCYRNELWKEFYTDGSLKSIGNYKKNQKINTWKYFHKNGNLMRFEDYPYDNDYKFSFDNPYFQSEPFLIAEYEYYENGQLKTEGRYEKSYDCIGIDSIYITDPETGKETLQTLPVETCSKKCGIWNYYFPDGSLMKKEEY